jgi:hypothetical protein
MNKLHIAALLAALSLAATGAQAQCLGDCDGDNEVTVDEIVGAVNRALTGCASQCAVTPPATWTAPDWAASTAEALALRARLDALAAGGLMRAAEQGTAVIGSAADLVALNEAGEPSLADVTTPAFDAIVADAFAGFVAAANAGPGDPIDDEGNWTPAATGGIYGNSQRGMDSGGIELRQIIDKGLFAGGALYNYALGLTEGAITPATIDALAATWGGNENLDPAGALTDSANYSRQMGYHGRIATALIAARAYAGSGDCTAERDDALRDFFALWEESMYARILFYANQGATRTAAATGDDNLVEALHQVAEGVGLALGFRAVPNPSFGPLAGRATTVQRSEVDAVMAAIGVDRSDLGASTLGFFIEDAAAFAAAALAVEELVADIYDFSPAEVASFRAPTAG